MFIIGLDNGFYVKSNKRAISREMLPAGMNFPFDHDYGDAVEIIYWRKNWGLRNAVMNAFYWRFNTNITEYIIETPEQVFTLIEVIASFLDKEKWENEGDSIWEYENERLVLIQNIINLAMIYSFMQENQDVYLEFYDSY